MKKPDTPTLHAELATLIAESQARRRKAWGTAAQARDTIEKLQAIHAESRDIRSTTYQLLDSLREKK